MEIETSKKKKTMEALRQLKAGTFGLRGLGEREIGDESF